MMIHTRQYNTLKSIGITFQRDVRDVNYTSSTRDFMNTTSKNDLMVMQLSDEYIKSPNCIYEVAKLFNIPGF